MRVVLGWSAPPYRRGVLRLLPALAALIVLVLTGCGDDQDRTASPGAAEDPLAAAGSQAQDAMAAEVSTVAPTLESAYRDAPYPRTVGEVVESLTGAGVTLAPGHEVGGYAYDPDAVEFVLCLQDADGAWASYDTAPMGVRDAGATGGCPSG
ncbi:MAG: hypothetical protein JWN84_3821 [Nocardioides sp.]|nr:hypothetical protein [Nocardioides sp.]